MSALQPKTIRELEQVIKENRRTARHFACIRSSELPFLARMRESYERQLAALKSVNQNSPEK